MMTYLFAEDRLTEIWITRDKREIPIRKMTDRHLVHSVNMMLRQGSLRLQQGADDALIYAERFRGQANSRGREDLVEICRGASEKLRRESRDADAIVALLKSEDPLDVIFQAIVAEAKKRRLWQVDAEKTWQLVVPEERMISS